MGLPLAAVYADVTGNVIGADIDPDVVETVNRGNCHVKREPGLPGLVEDLHGDGSLRAVVEPFEAAREAAIHVVIVPTPITDDNEPDLSILKAATESIAAGLSPGDSVVVECTVPPGTTEGMVRETLVSESGLDEAEFGLSFCPERTSSGRALKDIRGAYPKVVGGIDAESRRVARVLYEEINDEGVLPVSDATTAEAVKIFEGLYRDVNIALANELARFTDEMGIDVREAIKTANTQPFCDIHDPGPGVGGHCIPFYPYFVIEPFETPAPLLRTAREVNDSMPAFTVERLQERIGDDGSLDGVSVAVLGLTYRAGVEELRAAPALEIIRHLNSNGAETYGVDPLVDEDRLDVEISLCDVTDLYDRSLDAVVLVTGHEEFEDVEWGRLNDDVVCVDGRDFLETSPDGKEVYTIGEASWSGGGNGSR